jgi:hypothetical protein
MNLPDFVRAVEEKLFDVIRDAFARFHQDFHRPSHELLMASIDTINQTLAAIQADVAQIKANQANQPPVVATQDQLDAIQAQADGVKADLDTLIPQPAA